MSGILFFIFASCEPLSYFCNTIYQGIWLPPPVKFKTISPGYDQVAPWYRSTLSIHTKKYKHPTYDVTMTVLFRLQVQGSIMVASCLELLLGFTGVISVLLNYIGPITIAPVLSLIGLGVMEAAAEKAGQHWSIAAL